MLVFGLIMVILALAGGFLMLWKLPLPRRFRSLGNLPVDFQLSVIIPCRNEEKRLPFLLASLRDQDLAPAEVIVVDDDSSDATVSVAEQKGIRVIPAASAGDDPTGAREELRTGKSRACWVGAQAAAGEILLFLDADTRLVRHDSLRRLALNYKKQGTQGILSVQPYHRVKKLYENLSAVFNIIVLAGMNIFTPWGRKLPVAGAFGPCLMCRKDEYLAVGGHVAVRSAVLDDLSLGSLFVEKGLPVYAYGGRGLIHFRMYPEGLRQLFEGWTKNFASGAGRTHLFLLLMIILWIGGAFSSVAMMIRSIQQDNAVWIMTAVVLCIAYLLQMFWLAFRAGDFNPLCLAFYPVLHLFFVIVFLWSLVRTKIFHSVKWRGRRIRV